MNERQKGIRWTILILFVLAVLAILMMPRETGSAQTFDSGYPAPVPTAWGYPAPAVDPWCEEAAVMGMPVPWWCPPVIGEAVATVVSEPEAIELTIPEVVDLPIPEAAVMKIGGRMKHKEGGKE